MIGLILAGLCSIVVLIGLPFLHIVTLFKKLCQNRGIEKAFNKAPKKSIVEQA